MLIRSPGVDGSFGFTLTLRKGWLWTLSTVAVDFTIRVISSRLDPINRLLPVCFDDEIQRNLSSLARKGGRGRDAEAYPKLGGISTVRLAARLQRLRGHDSDRYGLMNSFTRDHTLGLVF